MKQCKFCYIGVTDSNCHEPDKHKSCVKEARRRMKEKLCVTCGKPLEQYANQWINHPHCEAEKCSGYTHA